MDKKSRIDIYETIYNVVLVVANQYTTIEEIREIVEYTDGEEIDDEIMVGCANVTMCRRKSNKMDALLVKYNHIIDIQGVNKTLDLINTVSHEAGHVALRIYQHMDQEVYNDSQEPFCYLLGWAAECIYKTVKGL